MYEHLPPTICTNYIDLDCNDSSGATDADYNGEEITCLEHESGIADTDVKLLYDAPIQSMTVRITGFVPDAPEEQLEITTSVANIDVTGEGTDMLVLSNAGGAKSTDFREQLQYVLYTNQALSPTAGLRTVEVQFMTTAGSMSNVATAFINVIQLPEVEVDLGPDIQLCEGESVTLDAGNPGAAYSWSTGQHTQSITTDVPGEYIVTVSNGVQCPGSDTIEVETLPTIEVSLISVDATCDNESITLYLITDAPFPIDVEVSVTPGFPLYFNNITGTVPFTEQPVTNTEYAISSVLPSEPACIEYTNVVQYISVFPTYLQNADTSICTGDSIWLGFGWESEAGVYENTFNTIHHCDSTIITTLTLLPAVQLFAQSATCDSSEAGVFTTFLNNPNGCDTVVQTTVMLLSPDTTLLNAFTCTQNNSGVTYDTLSNLNGCDSVIITTTTWIPPSDTSFIHEISCDSAKLGTAGVWLQGVDGCDSLILTTTEWGLADTTYTFGTSCDSSSLGVFETLLTSIEGCDSLILHTVTYSSSDSTFQTGSTCDPDAGGVFVATYTNQFGCDSIVTTTIEVLPADSTVVTSTTCDPDSAGVFVYGLQNQNGCDSIVTETVSLLPEDATAIFTTTCIASEAGVFITEYVNQYGCDSMVTETVTLLAVDTTKLTYMTCEPAEVGEMATTYTGMDGCDSLVIETTLLHELPEVHLAITSDFNGYAISCEGGSDGSVTADATGAGPFMYAWSTGDTEGSLFNLEEGTYAVTITDSHGCITSGEINLTAPAVFVMGFVITEPDCFDTGLGSIAVEATGGVGPYAYSIDGSTFQFSPEFKGLGEGVYLITSLDANDCEATELIAIHVPLQVQVELGENQVITLGDSAQLQAVVNLPFDSLAAIQWTGTDSTGCPECLTQIVAPVITTAYAVRISSVDGCADSDTVVVYVATDHSIYIPNIFSPNGDGINDGLEISGGKGIEEIISFSIFDRWGNLVFSASHFQPDDAGASWDGTLNGRRMNPGVFTYKVIVVFEDGREEVLYGDVTLVR